jgi:hypothetical protein
MIFALDLRPKIIPPAPFSLSNPDDPAFNNSLLQSEISIGEKYGI